MKIKKIHFKKHNIFNNHTVIFGDAVIPTISFLVGNNGSGKTKILDTIFQIMNQPHQYGYDFEIDVEILLSNEEMQEVGINGLDIIYNIKKEGGTNTHQVRTAAGAIARNTNMQSFSKIIYSTIEVNFNEQVISSVTSKNIDDIVKPREKSQNLSNEIPQLLIDIKSLDDSDISQHVKNNKDASGNVFIPNNLGNRLKRFTDAFDKIYDGSKSFSDIKNIANSKRIIFTDPQGNEISLGDLSTGEKQIIYRVGYILKNLGNINGGIILIDEPEISLHPAWQMKLKDFLLEVFSDVDVQIIIATHSPYIFKNLNESTESCIKIDRTKSESKKVSLVFPRVPYNPSVNLINYVAYNIPSELLHIELYTLLQIREGRDKITNSWNRTTNSENSDGIENWLQDTNGGNVAVKQIFTRSGKSTTTSETIMTWIRNKIHHPNEASRPNFSETDLQESIDKMIELLLT